MKTAVECLPCFLRQALQVATLTGCSDEVRHQVVKSVASILPEVDLEESPPANVMRVYETIAEMTGCVDPYYHIKQESNRAALASLPRLRVEVREADEPLALAMLFAIAGNIIDYGAFEKVDVEGSFRRSRTAVPAIDHTRQFLAKVAGLERGAKVLYLADNCGEIGYDVLVLECLGEYGFDITVAVKNGPIINDATKEDARAVGLDQIAHIIDNGTACPGTPLHRCSREFLQLFETADLVISKGQGNFETLSEVERELFFLLTVKCKVVAKHMAETTGTDQTLLPGCGEMIILHSMNRT